VKRIDCPDLGPRNITEFAWGGELQPAVSTTDAAAWAASVWQRTNAAGAVTEWWYHIPTSTWHIVQRSTLTDEQIGTAVPA
jgi:sarcosine oxidase, subunit delta